MVRNATSQKKGLLNINNQCEPMSYSPNELTPSKPIESSTAEQSTLQVISTQTPITLPEYEEIKTSQLRIFHGEEGKFIILEDKQIYLDTNDEIRFSLHDFTNVETYVDENNNLYAVKIDDKVFPAELDGVTIVLECETTVIPSIDAEKSLLPNHIKTNINRFGLLFGFVFSEAYTLGLLPDEYTTIGMLLKSHQNIHPDQQIPYRALGRFFALSLMLIEKQTETWKKELIIEFKKQPLEQMIETTTATLADELLALQQENRLESTTQKKEKIQNDLRTALSHFQKKLADGLDECIKSYSHIDQSDQEIFLDEIKLSLIDNFSYNMSTEEELQNLGIAYLRAQTWQDLLEIPGPTMKALYKSAKWLFDNKKYISAEKVFTLLATLNGKNPLFWISLAHTRFHLNEYTDAIDAYAMAILLNPKDSYLHIWSANAYEKLKDFSHQSIALEEALDIVKAQKPVNQSLVNEIQQNLMQIKK